MKKTLILTGLFIILSNCELKVSTRESVAQSTPKDYFYVGSNYYKYQFHTEERDGMIYGVWSLKPQGTSSQTGYAVAVTNLTKDALEVELLKLQISELHSKLQVQNNP